MSRTERFMSDYLDHAGNGIEAIRSVGRLVGPFIGKVLELCLAFAVVIMVLPLYLIGKAVGCDTTDSQ